MRNKLCSGQRDLSLLRGKDSNDTFRYRGEEMGEVKGVAVEANENTVMIMMRGRREQEVSYSPCGEFESPPPKRRCHDAV